MRFRAIALISLLLAASVLLTSCEGARERREARQAAVDATPTALSQDTAPLDVTARPGDSSSTPPVESVSTLVSSPPRPAQPTCGGSVATGSTIEALESEGAKRSYRLYVPSSYDASRRLPLVLNFHGFGSSALEQERYSGIVSLAEQFGFIAVTPDGTSRPQRWYIYGRIEPGYGDDVAFVDRLLDAVSSNYCVDPSRIYAMGISNGGGMSALLGCRLSHRIAAIAPVAGSPYSSVICRDAGPMPITAFHGTDDSVVPFEGGLGGRLGLQVNAVRDNMRGWAEHNGCDLTLSTQRIAADVTLESYGDCTNGADVQLYVVEGGGHTWPGSSRNIAALGSTTQSINAGEIAWRFFANHSKR